MTRHGPTARSTRSSATTRTPTSSTRRRALRPTTATTATTSPAEQVASGKTVKDMKVTGHDLLTSILQRR